LKAISAIIMIQRNTQTRQGIPGNQPEAIMQKETLKQAVMSGEYREISSGNNQSAGKLEPLSNGDMARSK
jgi:hypothetical protein